MDLGKSGAFQAYSSCLRVRSVKSPEPGNTVEVGVEYVSEPRKIGALSSFDWCHYILWGTSHIPIGFLNLPGATIACSRLCVSAVRSGTVVPSS